MVLKSDHIAAPRWLCRGCPTYPVIEKAEIQDLQREVALGHPRPIVESRLPSVRR